jgi:HSP20 family protein
MKLVKSTNGNPPAKISDPFGGLWNDFFQAPFPNFFSSPSANWPERFRVKSPVIDVCEDDKEVIVKAEIAGISEKDVELSWLDGVLYIKGEKKEETEDKSRRNTWHKESWYGSFTRGVPLGDDLDFQKAQAKYKDGVIQVRIPKVKGSSGKANTIEIQ